ncbi:MAG: (d)CMP kinase [Desulfomonilaceae bacterium]|jgi:cytidylate kinase
MTINRDRIGNQSGFVIAIDGPAGAGKTTIARKLAECLGFFMLDSGALYRALALALLRRKVSPECDCISEGTLSSIRISIQPISGGMKLFLDGEDISAEIRSEEIGVAASKFSAKAEARKALLGLQRSVASERNIVAEGRDMGAIVFPFAQVKFFLTADPEERAKRRYSELVEKGESIYYSQVLSEMRARDYRDETRSVAPMVPASDAVILDTTRLAPDEVVSFMLERIREKRFPKDGEI